MHNFIISIIVGHFDLAPNIADAAIMYFYKIPQMLIFDYESQE